jgi:flagellar hook-associated protein 1 FlgK
MSFDGLEITVKNALANDSFTVKPVGDAIVNMKVAVTDESKIAMAKSKTTDPNVDKGKR